MAIPESIKQKANKIRNEVYGKDVREALASGIEEAGDIADQANTKSNDAVEQVDNIQAQVNQLVVEGDSSVEAAQARVDAEGKSYPTLKARLDAKETEFSSQLASIEERKADKESVEQLSSQLAQNMAYEMEKESLLKTLPITPKAVYNQGGVVMVVSRKPHGNGFVRFKLRDNQFTTNVSMGAPAELLRTLEVLDVDECFTFIHEESAVDNSSYWTTLNINYVKVGIGQQTLKVRSTVNRAVGRWIEYTVNLPKGINEVIALIYKSSGSSTNVDVSVDGSKVLTGLDFSGSGLFERLVIPVGRSGSHRIRFTTNTAERINIAGVNVTDLQDYIDGIEYDSLVCLFNSNSRQYVTSNGAMEYAMLDADTGLWCGSVHGGETRSSLTYILDGQRITMNDGDVQIGRILEVEQETNIAGKLDSFHVERFAGDGSVEHDTVFNGNINLNTLFVNMSTTLDTFNEVLYPIRFNMAGLTDNDRIYLPQGVNYVVQRNPETMQKVTSIMTNKKIPADTVIVPYIKKTAGVYNKVYYATIQSDTPVNFKGGHFKRMHIFE